MTDHEGILEVATEAARAAARVHGERRAGIDPSRSTEKGHADWVTEVDHAAEAAAVEVIREACPGHAIAAEEGEWEGPAAGDAEVTWYIDPLDGTTNYLHGYPFYAASVAALDGEGPLVGVVVNSARGETFRATRGRGAERDGAAIRVSEVSDLKRALIGTGYPFKRPDLLDEYVAQFRTILPRTSGIRRTGSAACDLCDLACGRLDGFWELYLAPWDVAAGVVILREAGGVITDLGGGSEVVKHGAFLAGNPGVYAALREVLAGV